MSAHKWQFASRFRRHAFGWRSDMPVQRIKEAIAEIKQVARKESPLKNLPQQAIAMRTADRRVINDSKDSRIQARKMAIQRISQRRL